MSYRIYPVTHSPIACDDYSVKVNGKAVELNTARVSAVPFNRRWPGHQRSVDQTEVIEFLSLATDEPISFEITPREAFKSVKIRPKSLGITPQIENGIIKFTLDKPAYFTVEPYGRRGALHIFADSVTEYEVNKNADGVIYFGAGEYDVGMLELKSNQTLFIDEGAVVYGCIRALDAENIKIIGHGILDNSKNKEAIIYEANVANNEEAICNATRIHTVQLEYCKNVEIDGITVRDSLVYNIRPIGCEGVSIRNVKIIGCWRYNSDGIDMHNCKDVRVSHCFIRTFDDSICVKGFDLFNVEDIDEAIKEATYHGGKCYDVFSNALIEDCVIWNDWGKALEIGAEAKAEEIYNIVFQNCDIIHLSGKALDCMNVDYADIHDVVFRDIRIECDEEIPMPLIQGDDGEKYENPNHEFMPLTVRISVDYHPEYSKGSASRRGKIRNIFFEGIHVFGSKSPIINCYGYDAEHKVENVRITNLFLNGKPIHSLEGDDWRIGNFTESISLSYDPYLQMKKNSVSARGQLKETELVKFEHIGNGGPRIMFVGNSITLHGYREQIGWFGVWGMAASAKERDYVHLTERRILEEEPDASFCICQVSSWESQYKSGETVLPLYRQARNFEADIILIRCIENCSKADFDDDVFITELDKLISYLDAKGGADIVITTSFWHHPGDNALRKYAKEKGYPIVELGDLGERDDMKAIGLFEHSGVANHPGDLGMQTIAKRVSEPILRFINERK